METISAVKNTIAENFGGGVQNVLASDAGKWSTEQTPDQSGKVAIVTGGSEGIGFGVTHTLLKHNIKKLYILSVSQEVVSGAKDAVAKELGQDVADRTVWKKCDMSDWKSVKQIAQEISKENDRLDMLYNNAGRGIMTAELTDYGVDRHMSVNHFGHVILTSYLMPLLKQTAEKGNTVRIVNQSSNAHQNAPRDTKFASLEEINKDEGPNGQYGRAKLATLLYAKWLNKKVTQAGNPKILANATHPGFVSSKMSKVDILEPYPMAGWLMAAGMEPFKKDQFEGATPMLFAGTATTKSGQYICPPAIVEEGSELAQSDELADSLMKLTESVIKGSKNQGSFDDLQMS